MSALFSSPDTAEIIRIPKKIQQDIIERGFHLYTWISPDEVKLSIERDFLKVLRIIGIPLAIISIIVAIFSWGNVWAFFFVLFVGIAMMFTYLLILSLQRSILLSKSAFVILTDSSISLWGKIQKLSDFTTKDAQLEKMEDTFEEELFWKSRLSETKVSLGKDILEQLFGWYNAIFEWGSRFRMWNSRDSAKWILIILAFYTLYVIVMSVVYFIGVLFLLIFWWMIVWINRKYLELRGNTVMKINSLFWQLHEDSEKISALGYKLKNDLQQAQNNDWKDGLLLELQSDLSELSKVAQKAVDDVNALETTIENSRYKDMFSTKIYHKWIKKQITKPLIEISELLQNTLEKIHDAQHDIERQISTKPTGKNFLENLKLQQQRLNMQEKDISAFIPQLEAMLEKLK